MLCMFSQKGRVLCGLGARNVDVVVFSTEIRLSEFRNSRDVKRSRSTRRATQSYSHTKHTLQAFFRPRLLPHTHTNYALNPKFEFN